MAAASRSISFVHAACGVPLVASGQWAMMLKAGRKAFSAEVRRMAPLSSAMVRQTMGVLLRDGASEEGAALGVGMTLGFVAGAQFSDLRGSTHADISVTAEGLFIRPKSRKNARTKSGAPRAKQLRELAAARVGGQFCVVERYEHFAAKCGWRGSETALLPFKYGNYLALYRKTLQFACGTTAAEAATFGTHSGRRGAAHEARAGGAAPRAMRSFGVVTSEHWEDWYADGLIPIERLLVSRQMAQDVARA